MRVLLVLLVRRSKVRFTIVSVRMIGLIMRCRLLLMRGVLLVLMLLLVGRWCRILIMIILLIRSGGLWFLVRLVLITLFPGRVVVMRIVVLLVWLRSLLIFIRMCRVVGIWVCICFCLS